MAEELRRPGRFDPAGDGRHRLTRTTWAPSAAAPRPTWPPQLRRVAAAARETADRPGRRAGEGRARHAAWSPTARSPIRARKRAFGFGELTKGKKLTKTIGAGRPDHARRRSGRSPARSVPKVDGRRIRHRQAQVCLGRQLPGHAATARCCGRRRSRPRWSRSI